MWPMDTVQWCPRCRHPIIWLFWQPLQINGRQTALVNNWNTRIWCPLNMGYWFRPRVDVIKWKHFPRYWPFVRGIHRSPVNSPHKGQWHGALMFSLICACINGWVNNRKAGDLRRYSTHYDVIVVHSYHMLEYILYSPAVKLRTELRYFWSRLDADQALAFLLEGNCISMYSHRKKLHLAMIK